MTNQSSTFEQWFVKRSYQEFVKQEGEPKHMIVWGAKMQRGSHEES